MAKQLQKLELNWIGKGNEPKLEPRLLIEDPSKSYGDPKSENMLIYGDNLLELKALEHNLQEKLNVFVLTLHIILVVLLHIMTMALNIHNG